MGSRELHETNKPPGNRELRGDSASSVIITVHCSKRTAKKKKKSISYHTVLPRVSISEDFMAGMGNCDVHPKATPHIHYPLLGSPPLPTFFPPGWKLF